MGYTQKDSKEEVDVLLEILRSQVAKEEAEAEKDEKAGLTQRSSLRDNAAGVQTAINIIERRRHMGLLP